MPVDEEKKNDDVSKYNQLIKMCKQTADEWMNDSMSEEENCKPHIFFLIFCLRQIYHDHTQTHTIIILIYRISIEQKREQQFVS